MADWAWILGPGPGLLEEGLMAAAALRGRKRNPEVRVKIDLDKRLFPDLVKLPVSWKKGMVAYLSSSRSESSYGQPVLVYHRRAYGPAEVLHSVTGSDPRLPDLFSDLDAAMHDARYKMIDSWNNAVERVAKVAHAEAVKKKYGSGAAANPADGIQFVLGITRHDRGPKGGVTQIQSVMFDKDLWTRERAAAWLKAHDLRSGDSESQANFWRFRQLDPADFEEFRVIGAGARNPRWAKGHGATLRISGQRALRLGKRNPESDAEDKSRIYVEVSHKGTTQDIGVLYENVDKVVEHFKSRGSKYNLFPLGGNAYRLTLLSKGRKHNPESDAASLYEDFHGRPPSQLLNIATKIHEPDELAGLGELVEVKVHTLSGLEATLGFRDNPPLLCASPDGRQLYFQGGDQSLDLHSLKMDGEEWERASMVIGVLLEVVYSTKKGFDRFRLTDYQHRFADPQERGGSECEPMLLYDPSSKLLAVAGGNYLVKREGITG